MTDRKDRCFGSLLGGAVGDALGYPVEFKATMKDIVNKYGAYGITSYDLNAPWIDKNDNLALISDDTQMTLYTAEGLLEAAKYHIPVVDAIKKAYLVWFGHQERVKISVDYESSLGKIRELNQNRAPGITCIDALFSHSIGAIPHNDSKGCGGIMRIAPIALYGACHGWSMEETGRIAGEVAEITHLHPMSSLASATQAMIIWQCIQSDEPTDSEAFRSIVELALLKVAEIYPDHKDYVAKFQRIIRNAIANASNPSPDWMVIEDILGGGWVAEETLAIAVFSVFRHIDDFKACMTCAVNHGGDSDSTGAVAGNILGAILGRSGIPDELVTPLQFHELIIDMADRLTSGK